MSALAHHMRMSGFHISNEDVDSRKAAITALKTSWLKKSTYDFIFAKVADISAALGGDGTPSETLGKEVETAVQKKASAFLFTERPLDVGIVAGMTAIEIMKNAPDLSGSLWEDIWAATLWLALSYQVPLTDEKREALRIAVMQAARDRSIAGAEKGRERIRVPDLGDVSLIAGKEAELISTFKKASGATIDALRRNSALDREELDFLWWAQGRRSRLLKRPLDALAEIVSVIAAGIEGAEYLRRMPCEVHREIVLRTIDSNCAVTMVGILDALGIDQKALAAYYAGRLPTDSTAIFPLLTAITTGHADDTSASRMNRNAEEWGARALLEAALLKMKALGPSKL